MHGTRSHPSAPTSQVYNIAAADEAVLSAAHEVEGVMVVHEVVDTEAVAAAEVAMVHPAALHHVEGKSSLYLTIERPNILQSLTITTIATEVALLLEDVVVVTTHTRHFQFEDRAFH